MLVCLVVLLDLLRMEMTVFSTLKLVHLVSISMLYQINVRLVHSLAKLVLDPEPPV